MFQPTKKLTGLELISHTQELARIDERIRELSEQREKIQAYITPHKALISYPRRLPLDILEAIFLACLPTGRNAVMSAQEAPLLLCRICSGWRAAAISMPRLWASLHVPVSFILAKESRSSVVAQWLTRAAACPLSLSIRETPGNWNFQDYKNLAEASLVKSIAKSSTGWKKVELAGISSKMAIALAEINPMHLEWFTFTGSLDCLSRFSQILESPCLRVVNLYCDSELNLSLELPVAWHQLTDLVLQIPGSRYSRSSDTISLSNMILLVGRCHRLVSIRVAITDRELPFDYGALSAVLPFLESFSVPFDVVLPTWYLACITDCISMPKIRHFHVPIAGQDFETELFPLPSVASRLPLIQDMTIHLGTLDPPRLLEALQAFPALTKLVVYANVWYGRWDDLPEVPCGTTWILECLADITVCPRLQELEVVKADSLSKPILDAFLGARAGLESSSRLRCLTVTFGSSWNDTQYPEQFPTPTETEFYLSHGLTVLFYQTHPVRNTPSLSPWDGVGYI